MAVPEWPELAFWGASMARPRTTLTASWSMSEKPESELSASEVVVIVAVPTGTSPFRSALSRSVVPMAATVPKITLARNRTTAVTPKVG
jgi:hypothetical protein